MEGIKYRPKPKPLYRFNWNALQWHFAISFALIFITPLLDLIVFMPTYMELPRKEFYYSIWSAIIIAMLIIWANDDIPEPPILMEKNILTISFMARFLFGFSVADLFLLVVQWYYMHLSWPYLFKNIRFVGYQVIFGTGLFRILDMMDEHGQHLYVEKTIDYDGCALFIMQTIRLIMITTKVWLAHSIRWQISQRNLHLFQIMKKNTREKKEAQILIPFASLFVHQGQYFISRRLRIRY